MSSTTPVPASGSVQLVGTGQAARVTNPASSGTLSLKKTSDVTTSSFDFQVTAGSSRLQVGPIYAVGSVAITAFVEEIPVPPLPLIPPVTRFWGGAISPLKAAAAGGTNTTTVANRAWLVELDLPYRTTLTGLAYLVGTTGGGPDKAITALYDATGKVQAFSAIAGTTVGTANTYQSLDFVTPYEVLAPGKYFAGVITNGTTATIQVEDGSAGTAGATSVVGGVSAAASDFTANPVNVTAPTAVGAFPIIFSY